LRIDIHIWQGAVGKHLQLHLLPGGWCAWPLGLGEAVDRKRKDGHPVQLAASAIEVCGGRRETLGRPASSRMISKVSGSVHDAVMDRLYMPE
jgi:hypothetical protein